MSTMRAYGHPTRGRNTQTLFLHKYELIRQFPTPDYGVISSQEDFFVPFQPNIMSGHESRFTQPYQSGYTSSSASCSSTGKQNPMQGYPDLSSEYSYPCNMTQSSNSQFPSDMSLRASFEAQTYGADSSSDSSVQLDNNRPKFGNSAPKDPQELTCLYPGCRYTTARHFDLGRHMNNHFPPQGKLLDCPGKG